MAKASKSKVEKGQEAVDPSSDLKTVLGSKYGYAKEAMTPHTSGWEDKESMLLLKNLDRLSQEYRSSVNDGRLSTIVWERCSRVMSQIPTGQVRALTKADKGKSALMDLALWRYIIPNANTQFNHLIKLRLWNFYSAVYGTMPMLYFWKVSETYVGPDCHLVPIRNFFPQPGKVSIEDSDWCMISTSESVGQLKEYAKDDTNTWDTEALEKVIKKAQEGGKGPKDTNKMSLIEQDRSPNVQGEKGDFASVEVVTCYEAGKDGHWISFCPDYDNEIIRDIPNPHKDAKIPVVLKHCFPLVDSMIGLGDFERGKTLQFAMNSLVNLYLDTMKMQLYKPLMVNVNEVVASSIKQQPGAIWKTKTTPSAAIQEAEFSTNGLNTFQSTYSFLSGALQSQNGTTTAEVSSQDSGDPTFGKTPDAIKMTGQRQSARDDWDRFLMEKSVSELYEAFVNMMSCNHVGKDAIFHVFDKEVEKIEKTVDSEDVKKAFTMYDSGKAGKVNIGSGALRNTKYRFLIDSGSTKKEDQKEALSTLSQLMSVLPNFDEGKLAEIGEKVNWGELITQFVMASGIDGWEKIIIKDDDPKPEEPPPDPVKMLEAINFKVEKLPPQVQQMLYSQLAVKLGLDPSQLGDLGPTPDQQKLDIDREKLAIQREKLGQSADQADRKQNLEEQKHVMAAPAPGYAEPVDPLVAEMDRLAGIHPDQQGQPEPVGGMNER